MKTPRCIPSALLLPLLTAGLALADDPPDAAQARFEKAADYSEGKRGSSLLILREGKVVFERYKGREPDEASLLYSGTKSFWGVAVAVAIGEGVLTLDELACETLSEWKQDPKKQKITVRHLLHLTSGLDPAAQKLRSPRTTHKYAAALAVKALHEPGATYAYGPSHFYALGELLKRKLKKSPLDYLKAKVLDPIGLKVGDWKHDGNGDPHMPAGASLSAREWAKFGELLRLGGAWQGRQLVPREQLAACFQGSKANPAYGLTFWLNATGKDPQGATREAFGPKDLVFAAGFGDQRLYIFPSEKLVVVRQGRNHPSWSDAEFTAHLLGLEPPAGDQRARREQAKAEVLTNTWFERHDTDKDGVVRGGEIPPARARLWGRWDTDQDGALSRDEVQAVMQRRLKLLRDR